MKKSSTKMLFALLLAAMACTLILLLYDIADKTHNNEQNRQETQSVIAQTGINSDDENKKYIINEYAPDKTKNDWHKLFIDDAEDIEAVQGGENDATIRQITYGDGDGGAFVRLTSGAQVKNLTTETSQCLYAQSNLLPEYDISINNGPLVLIIHTHATESYMPVESDYYDEEFNSRTTDKTQNVIAVGDEIARALEQNGIGVVHDATLHDYPTHTGSYKRSAETVRNILAQYPSIKIVLDIHRDSITALDGARIAPVAEIDGKKAAQVMIISGCDDGTMNMPDYMQNFRLACLIQNKTERTYSDLMRPILFDYQKYNQDLTPGSLVIEVGSAANSLEQAKYAGYLLGDSIAQALISIASDT